MTGIVNMYCKDCGDDRSVSQMMNECVVCSAARNITYPNAIDCDKSRDHLYLEVVLLGEHYRFLEVYC